MSMNNYLADTINLSKAKRLVIKVGSALITNSGLGANQTMIDYLVEQTAYLRSLGKKVTIVTSGAIAQGMVEMNLRQRPSSVYKLQSLAAIGQLSLMQQYQVAFERKELKAAQVLLTHEDCRNYQRFYNASRTLNHLMDMGAVPIINENDTVAVEEIRFW